MRVPTLGDQAARSSAVDELILVGGDHTIEARNLTESAADAGLRIRWLTFDGAAAQAALAAHGPGSVRLPLVIVANSYCFQQPQFQQIEACLDTLAVGSPELPPDCVRVVIAE